MWKPLFVLFSLKSISPLPDGNSNLKEFKNHNDCGHSTTDKRKTHQQKLVSRKLKRFSFYDTTNLMFSSSLAYFISFSIFLNLWELFIFATSTFIITFILLDSSKDNFGKLIVKCMERSGNLLAMQTSAVNTWKFLSDNIKRVLFISMSRICQIKNILAENLQTESEELENIYIQQFEIKPDMRPNFQLKITKSRQLYEFSGQENQQNWTIKLKFLEHSVINEQQICVEIYIPPIKKDLPHGYYLLTPVVFISQQNSKTFLRPVQLTLPLIEEINAEKILFPNCEPRHKIELRGNNVLVTRFSFSGAGVAAKKQESLIASLRLLDSFDEAVLFEPERTFFSMKQLPDKSKLQGKLEFDCRAFRSWQEHDAFRQKTNYSFASISHTKHFRDITSVKDGIEIKITEIPLHMEIRNSGVLKFDKNLPPENSESQVITRNYKLTADMNESELMFIFGDFEINFPIYSHNELEQRSENVFSKEDIQEFLLTLDADWLQFLDEYINIEKRYLQEFLEMDLEETIRSEIQNELAKTSTGNGTFLKDTEQRLLELPGWESIRKLASKITETDRISRIIAICKLRFDILYKTIPYEAKSRLMIDLELGDNSVGRLQEGNLCDLAKVLVGYNNDILKKQMKNAYEKHALDLSDQLLRKLGVDIPEGDYYLT